MLYLRIRFVRRYYRPMTHSLRHLMIAKSIAPLLVAALLSACAGVGDKTSTATDKQQAGAGSSAKAKAAAGKKTSQTQTLNAAADDIEPAEEVISALQQDLLDRPLKRGEWVKIRFASLEREELKQVIAIPSDSAVFDKGQLMVNGRAVVVSGQTYIVPKRQEVLLGKQLDQYDNLIPEGFFIAFADNAKRTYESSDYGLVSFEQIIERVSNTK